MLFISRSTHIFCCVVTARRFISKCAPTYYLAGKAARGGYNVPACIVSAAGESNYFKVPLERERCTLIMIQVPSVADERFSGRN